MTQAISRLYRGSLRAVILDWAGTTVDYGSFAPTAVFLRLFKGHGVEITPAQARQPMGLMKRDHLRAILEIESVRQEWQNVHGKAWDESDLDGLFSEFVPLQLACLGDYADPVPGCLETLAELRRRGMKIGSTTGYTRPMMEALVPHAARNGYSPDVWVCPDDVPAGRPYPWMVYMNAIRLGVYPMSAIVKVGDTLVDIAEGLNAGCWTVGLALSGNMLGLTYVEAQALPAAELAGCRAEITARLFEAGAHYVIDDLRGLPAIIDQIEARLVTGHAP